MGRDTGERKAAGQGMGALIIICDTLYQPDTHIFINFH